METIFLGEQSHLTCPPYLLSGMTDSHIPGSCVTIWLKVKTKFVPLDFWSVPASNTVVCTRGLWDIIPHRGPRGEWRKWSRPAGRSRDQRSKNEAQGPRAWFLSSLPFLGFCKILYISCPWALWDSTCLTCISTQISLLACTSLKSVLCLQPNIH